MTENPELVPGGMPEIERDVCQEFFDGWSLGRLEKMYTRTNSDKSVSVRVDFIVNDSEFFSEGVFSYEEVKGNKNIVSDLEAQAVRENNL